jgi:hypothetical protein
MNIPTGVFSSQEQNDWIIGINSNPPEIAGRR